MGMLEPSSPLWTDVKSVYNSWPPDDEAVAARLADAWRLAVDTVEQGAKDTAAARDRSRGTWPDDAGTEFGRRVGEYLTKLADLQQRMGQLHTRADHYRKVLFSAKKNIHDNINENEELYELYGNPLWPSGSMLKFGLVQMIANHLRDMITRKVAELQWDREPPPLTEDEVVELSKDMHELLDRLGIVPVVGEGADLANALLHALEGNFGEAGLSALGAIPGLGWGAAGVKAARAAKAAADLAGNVPGAPPVGADGRPDRTVEFGAESVIRVKEADGSYTLYLNAENYPESAKHVRDAQLYGHPDTLTVDESPDKKANTDARRDQSLQNFEREHRAQFGKPFEPFRDSAGKSLEDRDEYPPARMYEGGLRDAGTPNEEYANVRPIPAPDNRGSGSAWWRHGVAGLPDGTKVNVVVVPDDTP